MTAFSLQTHLNLLSDRVELTLAQYRAPASVTGGIVGPRIIRFNLIPAVGVRVNAITRLADELALAVGVSNVTIRRTPRGIVLEFPRSDPRTVRFLETLRDAEPLPNATALLGINDDGAPLLARLSSPEVAHILIAGTTGSGKSVLLRSIAASLVLSHTPETIRILCLDPKARAFSAFAGVPHLLRPILSDDAGIAAALRAATKLMELRAKTYEREPRIIVLIDELADIIMTATGSVSEPLTRIAQRGREVGIHLVAATQRPSAAILSGLMRANFPLRLVGRVVSADDARIAAGQPGTNAHTLTGRGDFLAVTGGQIIRFQAAYTDATELHKVLADWRAEPAAPDLLPEVQDIDGNSAAESTAQDDIGILAQRLAPWWTDHGGVWGSKSAACRHLFGEDVRYAGYHARLTDATIARVEE